MKLWAQLRARDQLLRWAEQGLLTSGQLEQALPPDSAQPAARHWLMALDRLLASYGIVLLASGVIFFFAFNWDELHRFAKFGLAAAALTVFAGTACLVQPHSHLYRAALFGAALASGGLLALVGQTYQTGADIWQLFAVWALLILPWALLARSELCWALLWLVLNIALIRYFSLWSFWSGEAAEGGWRQLNVFSAVALMNTALLLVIELIGGPLSSAPNRVLPRLCGLVVLSALGVAACLAWWDAGYRWAWIALGAVCLVGMPLYRALRVDSLLLALQLYALIGVLTVGLMHALEDASGFLLLVIPGLFLLLLSTLASIWLQRIVREVRR